MEASLPKISLAFPDEPPPVKIKVLLVEDHALVRQGLRSVLDSYPDLEVAEASNGGEAVAVLETFKPSVVIIDINMPGKNGVQTTIEIKTDYPHIKVIGLSVDSDALIRDAMSKAGAAKVLSKETAFDELYPAIRSVLGKESSACH